MPSISLAYWSYPLELRRSSSSSTLLHLPFRARWAHALSGSACGVVGVCSSECSLATLVVEGQVPTACDVVALVVGCYMCCLVGGFEAEMLLATPLPQFTLAQVCNLSCTSSGWGLAPKLALTAIHLYSSCKHLGNLVLQSRVSPLS